MALKNVARATRGCRPSHLSKHRRAYFSLFQFCCWHAPWVWGFSGDEYLREARRFLSFVALTLFVAMFLMRYARRGWV